MPTINGQCFHMFLVKPEGLVCEDCGYVLPLRFTNSKGTDIPPTRPNGS